MRLERDERDRYRESAVSEMAAARHPANTPELVMREASRGWAKTRTRLT